MEVLKVKMLSYDLAFWATFLTWPWSIDRGLCAVNGQVSTCSLHACRPHIDLSLRNQISFTLSPHRKGWILREHADGPCMKNADTDRKQPSYSRTGTHRFSLEE